MNKKNEDYIVLFQGIKLSKFEANKVGVGILFGIAGIFLTLWFQVGQNIIIDLLIIFFLSAIGYWFVGNRIFKEKK